MILLMLPSCGNKSYPELKDDEANTFLIEYDASIKEMNQPCFWRAIDSCGKDIDIPKYIDALEYEIWE